MNYTLIQDIEHKIYTAQLGTNILKCQHIWSEDNLLGADRGYRWISILLFWLPLLHQFLVHHYQQRHTAESSAVSYKEL